MANHCFLKINLIIQDTTNQAIGTQYASYIINVRIFWENEMKKLLLAVLVLSLLLLITGCDRRKDADKITSMKDLVVSEDFTFQTVKPVHLTLTSVDVESSSVPSAAFRIFGEAIKLCCRPRPILRDSSIL